MNDKLIKMGILFGAAAAFGVASIIVVATKGKSNYFIAKKLKFGAVIIGLTGSLSGCMPGPSCYQTASSGFYIDNITENEKIVLGGIITRVNEESKFSYRIVKEENRKEVIACGEILPLDGNLDSIEERFKIELERNIPMGRYFILFYFDTIKNSEVDFDKNGYLANKLIIDETGKIVKERAFYIGEINEKIKFSLYNKEAENYSYVISSVGEADKILKQGDIEAVFNDESKNYELSIDKPYDLGNGYYEVKIYTKKYSEIDGKYNEYTYINYDVPTIKIMMIY